MPGGRPSKYTPELLAKARHYLDFYQEYGDQIPSHAGLSVELGVNRSTIYEWAKDPNKQEFSDIFAEILSTQERVLVAKGLSGDFNSAITKLVLGKHGYHEKQDQTVSGPNGGPQEHKWTVEVIDATPPDSE